MTNASARVERRTRAKPDVRLPDELETAGSKLVYLALAIAGSEARDASNTPSGEQHDPREGEGTSVDDLQRTLGLSKLTLLPILADLRDRGLVERTDGGYTVTESGGE